MTFRPRPPRVRANRPRTMLATVRITSTLTSVQPAMTTQATIPPPLKSIILPPPQTTVPLPPVSTRPAPPRPNQPPRNPINNLRPPPKPTTRPIGMVPGGATTLIYQPATTASNLVSNTRRPPPPSTLNVTVLASVLGSVAFVCLSLILVACLVKKRRASRSRTTNRLDRLSSPQASGVYETVGPALPARTFQDKSKEATNGYEQDSYYIQPETVPAKNVIKQTQLHTAPDDVIAQKLRRENTYLEPIKFPQSNDNYMDFNDVSYKAPPGSHDLDGVTKEKPEEKETNSNQF